MAMYHTREAIRLVAKATKLTQAEIREVLIRRYLPDFVVDFNCEVGGKLTAGKVGEWAAANCGDSPRRRVAISVKRSRISKGITQRKAAELIGWELRNYQRIECGSSRGCTPSTTTKIAIAFDDEKLANLLKTVNWWRGD